MNRTGLFYSKAPPNPNEPRRFHCLAFTLEERRLGMIETELDIDKQGLALTIFETL